MVVMACCAAAWTGSSPCVGNTPLPHEAACRGAVGKKLKEMRERKRRKKEENIATVRTGRPVAEARKERHEPCKVKSLTSVAMVESNVE